MNKNHQLIYWVLTQPNPAEAGVLPFAFWSHHPGQLARSAWAAQLAIEEPGASVEEASRNPSVQLYSVRLGRYVSDEATFPAQGLTPGDVLVLLPDASEQWRGVVEAYGALLPTDLPVDLPVQPGAKLPEVKTQLMESRSAVNIDASQGGMVNISNSVVANLEHSQAVITKSAADPALKDLVQDLIQCVTSLVEGGTLEKEDAEAAGVLVEDVANEAAKDPKERNQPRWSRALRELLSIGGKVGAVGAPLVEMAVKIQGMLT